MKLMQYLQDSRAELARVTWPTRQQVIEGTQAVLVFVFALGVIIFLFDQGFSALIRMVLQ